MMPMRRIDSATIEAARSPGRQPDVTLAVSVRRTGAVLSAITFRRALGSLPDRLAGRVVPPTRRCAYCLSRISRIRFVRTVGV